MLEAENPKPPFSKRAARRLIQRAFVLAVREKAFRQHIREAELTTLWVLEDWNMAWTVSFQHGRLEVGRRPAKHPEITLSWPTAEEFFLEAERWGEGPARVQFLPVQVNRRFFEPVLRAFFTSLRHVLSNPVDDQGESLL